MCNVELSTVKDRIFKFRSQSQIALLSYLTAGLKPAKSELYSSSSEDVIAIFFCVTHFLGTLITLSSLRSRLIAAMFFKYPCLLRSSLADSANLSRILSSVYGSEGGGNILWIQSFSTANTPSLYALPAGVLLLMRQTWRVCRPGQLKVNTLPEQLKIPSNTSSVLCFEKKYRHYY